MHMMSKRVPNKRILRMEELALNSWPALRSLQYDGWILRLANGFNDRCDCVYPLYGSNLSLGEKVERCEFFYASRGQQAVFRITSDGSRAQLDDLLEERGYVVKTPTVVQTFCIADLAQNSKLDEVCISNVPDECWVNDVVDVIGFSGSRSTYQEILQNITWPLGLARAKTDASVIGVGLGVVEDNCLALYGMHIRDLHRRKGWARKLMSALLQWGRGKGAEYAYLHVEKDNSPARTLYDDIGFNEIYRYWYRVMSPR